jgi:hypothetical protein
MSDFLRNKFAISRFVANSGMIFAGGGGKSMFINNFTPFRA